MKPMVEELSREVFLERVKRHELSIELDEGVFRHLRFGIPGTAVEHFYLTTWPGRLCISGDMGTFVFARLRDMFEFFGRDRINPGYWREKCEAADFPEGIARFSPDVAKEALLDCLKDVDPMPKNLEQAVREQLFWTADNGEAYFRDAVEDFRFDGFRFEDFWEVSLRDYTYHYIWCCHAITWGIDQYHKRKFELTFQQ